MLKKSLFVGLLLSLGLSVTAIAGEYPSKPITVIVPSKAGGSTDRTARMITEIAKAQNEGYEFVIKNVPGSGGQKGFEAINRAKADGHTIGLVFTPQLVAHVVSKRAKYNLDSFHVVGNVAQDPAIVVVPKDSKIKNLVDLAEQGKKDALTVAVNGIGSDDFLAAKAFEAKAGVKFNLLPTKGSTEQKAGILGGHVDVAFMNLSQMIAQHKAGDAHIIAVLGEERNENLPDMKTSKEQGFEVYMTATRGVVAPAKVDAKILTKLDEILAKVMASDEFKAKAKKGSIYLLPKTGPEYHSYLKGLQAETQAVYDKAPW
ncbi:MAG TPA: tripartite tricarboxylate transporter substrate binding protein [Psychromonas hadalis]|nr:tripartite tricarboxylate transporter substrate binding protein [Psychromonas hadalis]